MTISGWANEMCVQWEVLRLMPSKEQAVGCWGGFFQDWCYWRVWVWEWWPHWSFHMRQAELLLVPSSWNVVEGRAVGRGRGMEFYVYLWGVHKKAKTPTGWGQSLKPLNFYPLLQAQQGWTYSAPGLTLCGWPAFLRPVIFCRKAYLGEFCLG